MMDLSEATHADLLTLAEHNLQIAFGAIREARTSRVPSTILGFTTEAQDRAAMAVDRLTRAVEKAERANDEAQRHRDLDTARGEK